MASPGNRKSASSRYDLTPNSGNNSTVNVLVRPGENSSSKNDSPADTCFLEGNPSLAFTSSTVLSTSGIPTPTSGGKRKRSMRKLSVEAFSDIPLNDDQGELIEEKEKSMAEQEKSMNKSSKVEEETDISIVKTMTKEQMQEHMSRCLQLSTENKINTKNAFALKLIDCLTIITKNEEKSNFAAMACHLDAGTKIYSSRVDAVHQQVMKLVETCMFAEKKKKEKAAEGDDAADQDSDEGETGKDKEKKKKPRKKVIATPDQISRQPKENDPKDMFVKLEARPGDILNKAKYNSDDLSLTLEKHTPFWIDFQRYKPLKPEGENVIPDIDVKKLKLQPKVEMDPEIDFSSIPKKIESELFSSQSDPEEEDNEDTEPEMDFYSQEDQLSDSGEVNRDENEVNSGMVSSVISRMTSEGLKTVTNDEAIKTLLHNAGESDYHYLKMDSSNFWAGPSYWKRPQGHTHGEKLKKLIRKKKEPAEILYTEAEVSGEIDLKVKSTTSKASNKKSSTLSKRTMAKWSKKKVTYPQDIHFEPETLTKLFFMDIVAEVVHKVPNEPEQEQVNMGEPSNNDDEMNERGCGSPDLFDDRDDHSEGLSSEFKGFPSPKSSSGQSAIEFRGFPSPGGSSPFDPEHGFKGFGSQDDSTDEENENLTSQGDDLEEGQSSAVDAYEGENLVPMVKTVKVDPIRIVAKPNRVDMQHLKTVMLSIIRREIEDRENQLKNEGLPNAQGFVAFRTVLTQLFSCEQLHSRTREDLTVQMAFLCLLTLCNEYGFNMKKQQDTEDVVITEGPSD